MSTNTPNATKTALDKVSTKIIMLYANTFIAQVILLVLQLAIIPPLWIFLSFATFKIAMFYMLWLQIVAILARAFIRVVLFAFAKFTTAASQQNS